MLSVFISDFICKNKDANEVMQLDLQRINAHVTQSSVCYERPYGLSNIINGDGPADPLTCGCCILTTYDVAQPHWIQLDLGRQYPLEYMLITGPTYSKDVRQWAGKEIPSVQRRF